MKEKLKIINKLLVILASIYAVFLMLDNNDITITDVRYFMLTIFSMFVFFITVSIRYYLFGGVKEFRKSFNILFYILLVVCLIPCEIPLTKITIIACLIMSYLVSIKRIIPYQMYNCTDNEKDFLEDVTQKYLLMEYQKNVSFIVPKYNLNISYASNCLTDMLTLHANSVEMEYTNDENNFVIKLGFTTFDEFEIQKKEFTKTIKHDIL